MGHSKELSFHKIQLLLLSLGLISLNLWTLWHSTLLMRCVVISVGHETLNLSRVIRGGLYEMLVLMLRLGFMCARCYMCLEEQMSDSVSVRDT